jgi:hypothetical protein
MSRTHHAPRSANLVDLARTVVTDEHATANALALVAGVAGAARQVLLGIAIASIPVTLLVAAFLHLFLIAGCGLCATAAGVLATRIARRRATDRSTSRAEVTECEQTGDPKNP